MSGISEDILDTLTNLKMPSVMPGRVPDGSVEVEGVKISVIRCGTLVLGSGAAGLRAAVELKRRGLDVVAATSHLFGGTSACSGSDKQTLHTAGTSNRGDDFVKMANDISSGGCMHLDTAYIESIGSLYAFNSLIYLGLPLPRDIYGAVLRYKTDHDEVGRATSCGPRTSRLMTKVLCEEAVRLGVPFLTGCTGVRILVEDGKACGLVTVMPSDKANDYGLCLVTFEKLVLATGGPGELYRDSVYPKGCFGALGMAMEAGIEAVNLTESQFGISTSRDNFPWNLSGTYVQVMPYIYSVDDDGQEHNFLADYYRTTQELASNVFRKGYQWPFQAQRLIDYGSSLVDIAITIENSKGRKVYMDFNRNPEAVPDDRPFSLDDLDDDVRSYLENNDCLSEMPIDRLRTMNPLAIELYRSHGVDITCDPLEFSVNNQHLNGGLDVDNWGQTNLANCYAIGETAGTHGVTRPGGAALNAGQVFGTRCAEHIAANSAPDAAVPADSFSESLAAILKELENAASGELDVDEVKKEVQSRMTEKAGFACNGKDTAKALKDASELNGSIRSRGIRLDSAARAAAWFQVRQTALTSEAVLTALDHYIANGGGSRGARVICAEDGTKVPEASNTALAHLRFREEDPADRKKAIVVRYSGEGFDIAERDVRSDLDLSGIFFEKNWTAYLTGEIYR